jgi:flagella basal body P-ring formation protein FlgA
MTRVAPLLAWAAAAALVAPALAAASDAAEELRAVVREAWEARAGEGVEVDVLAVPVLPDGAAGGVLEADPPSVPIVCGVRPSGISRRVDGRVTARGLATVRVRRRVPVWIVARPLEAGAAIGAADLRREPRLFDREPARELLGEIEPGRWSARRALDEGTVLCTSDVARRPDVAAGAPVRLVARAGSARVSVAAFARRAGDVGDTILVLNPLTGSVVPAVLADAGTAVLAAPEAGGPVACEPGGNAP